MEKHNEKTTLARLTVTAEPSLLESVQQRRLEITKRTGLRVSTSACVSALIRAGLEATHAPQVQKYS